MIRNGFVLFILISTLTPLINGCGGGGGTPGSSNTDISGLDTRPQNSTCIAPERPTSNSNFTTTRVFNNLQFTSPVAMLQAPGDNSRWFIVELNGTVRVFDNDENTLTSSLFLDISTQVTSGGERGLLNMALHPDFANNGQAFLAYTATINNQLVSRISRFSSSDGGQTLNSSSEEILLVVNQPYNNHNGGFLAFGPDNYLYIGFGDGGSAGDPLGHGQDTTTLLGNVLRIDVDNGTPYAIPADNPFVSDPPNRAEIYAWGLRNPWRGSFDIANGSLWLGDVGQNQWEEINLIEANGNYGWNIREAAHCYNDPSESCSTAGLIDPVLEYDHANGGRSVTGGVVYRGTTINELQGAYIFGDFTNGKIWYLADTNSNTPSAQLLQDSGLNISSFGQDQEGEVYVVNYGGNIHKIVYQTNSNNDTIPALLSMTGCVDINNPQQATSGLIPYQVNASFWSDGAIKERWLAIPDNTTISINASHDWALPPGSVLMKHFRINNKLIETRLFMHHSNGGWGGYTYEWNDQETDATLVKGGKTRTLANQNWYYPRSADCMQCHTQAAGFSLGLETAQFNREINYTSSGRNANQLTTLDHIGLFSSPLSTTASNLPKLPEPFGNAAIDDRARAWLHTNCAQCHRSNGPTPVTLDLDYNTAMSQTGLCNQVPQSGNLGISDARIIAPGQASRSVLFARVNTRDANGMPPLASQEIDTAGVNLLQTWIAGMNNSCEY